MRHQIAIGVEDVVALQGCARLARVVTLSSPAACMYLRDEQDRSRGFGRGGDIVLTIADVALPLSIAWFCRAAFVLSLTLGATIIASDMQSGAFTFYFVRSIRPRDYVLGKLAGYGLLVATIVLDRAARARGLRLGLSRDDRRAGRAPALILPKVLAIGALATLAYTAVPLAILGARRRTAATRSRCGPRTTVIGGMIASASAIGVAQLRSPRSTCRRALQAVTLELFDLQRSCAAAARSTVVATPRVIAHRSSRVALAIAIVWFQVVARSAAPASEARRERRRRRSRAASGTATCSASPTSAGSSAAASSACSAPTAPASRR